MRPQDVLEPGIAAAETPPAVAAMEARPNVLEPGGAAVETPSEIAAVETRPARPEPPIAPVVDIVIPVYNEEGDLESSVRRLRAYLDDRFPFTSAITIADNASTDATWEIAWRLAGSMPGVRAIHLDQKGRGRALRRAWLGSEAPIVAYTDVDMSTDLVAVGQTAGVVALLGAWFAVILWPSSEPGRRALRRAAIGVPSRRRPKHATEVPCPPEARPS